MITRKHILTMLILAGLLLTAAPAYAAEPASALGGASIDARLFATNQALAWLAEQQMADGGFGDLATTSQVAQAILAAGSQPEDFQSFVGQTPLDYLTIQAPLLDTTDAWVISQVILACVSLGQDPTVLASRNWVALLSATLQADGRFAGSSPDGIATQAAAVRALRATYQPVPATALAWLRAAARTDGGWGILPGSPSDAYHTGLALQALILAGESPAAPKVRAGVAFLQGWRVADGGFAGFLGDTQSDILATTAAIQGLAAAGEPLLSAPWTRQSWSPFDAVLAHQISAGGFAHTSTESPSTVATAAGIQGLFARRLPLRQRDLAANAAVNWLHTQQKTDGSFDTRGNVTAEAVYVIALAGQDPAGAAWKPASVSAMKALENLLPVLLGGSGNKAAEASKATRAAVSSGRDPYAFGGYDLIAKINSYYDSASGSYYPSHLFRHSLAMDGLLMANAAVPEPAKNFLVNNQLPGGGWGWATGTSTPDVDTTGLALTALGKLSLPTDSEIFQRAETYLVGQQRADGSLPDRASASAGNSNSTALAIRGLLASGRDPRQEPFVIQDTSGGLLSLFDALMSYQEDSGAFTYMTATPDSRILAVIDAVPALLANYPAFQAPILAEASAAGQASLRRQGNRLMLVAPYQGDGNHDGTLDVRRWDMPSESWSEPLPVFKSPAAYLVELEPADALWLHVQFNDPDGVSGQAEQELRQSGVWLPTMSRH